MTPKSATLSERKLFLQESRHEDDYRHSSGYCTEVIVIVSFGCGIDSPVVSQPLDNLHIIGDKTGDVAFQRSSISLQHELVHDTGLVELVHDCESGFNLILLYHADYINEQVAAPTSRSTTGGHER